MPTPRSAVRVLVIDRDRRVRAALRQLLASEPGLTLGGEAADAASALGQLAAHPPAAVLIDPLLPTAADGTQVVQDLPAWGVAAGSSQDHGAGR